MSDNLTLMQEKLKEIFQYEKSDLDFGIYKILNLKRKEIQEFIDIELKNIVKDKFAELESDENNYDLEKLEKLKVELEEVYGESINILKKNSNPKGKLKEYVELEKSINSRKNLGDVEEDIYDRILTFFSRYYLDGDFISKGIYSNTNKYAIPYNGDEVYLHWANKDQYYIKTTEDFKDFKFVEKGYEVHFKIKEADVEQNNNKSDEKRLFIYLNHELNGKKLIFYFDYRGISNLELTELKDLTGLKKADKKSILQYNLIKMRRDINIDESSLSDLAFLNQKHKNKITNVESESSILKWNLNKYISKNSSDYFIHKDLKGFLLRELDFYIKNDMFNIDKVGEDEEIKFNLKKIKTFKEISSQIINFLAQIENFQLKLWEKKKFVIDTNYCITLDYINEKYYPEILKNEKQLEEWKQLGFIESSVDIKYLKEHPTLVLDTKFYSADFKYQILSEIDDLEENTNGILINSENFQALNLMLEKYKEKIKCCYIDPPYNTGNDGFLYKDGYSHSSWMSLMNDRLILARELLNSDGSLFSSIGKEEFSNLKSILINIFEEFNYLSTLARLQKGGSDKGNFFKPTIDYLEVVAKDKLKLPKFKIAINKKIFKKIETKGPRKGELYEDSKSLYQGSLDERSNQRYYIECPDGSLLIPPGTTFPKIKKDGSMINPNKGDGCWRWALDFGYKANKHLLVFKKVKNSPLLDELGNPSKWNVYTKRYLKDAEEKGNVPSDLILDFINSLGTQTINNLGLNFKFPKPIELIIYLVKLSGKNDLILDFFAGSGTTGHAVLKLNKEDEGNRKFILVEMGEYFDTVLKPRIQKVIYSDNWKNGKPLDSDGSKKQIIKYQSLEQYEDTLNNISFEDPNQLVLARSDYKIKYMLNLESRNNNVFMNVEQLESPFDYKLIINGKERSVDLVETFNYVTGIYVSKIQQLENNSQKYIIIKGKRKNKKVIVFWRNIKSIDRKEDKKFIESLISDEDEIFVNSASLVKNAIPLDIIFKEEFFGGM